MAFRNRILNKKWPSPPNKMTRHAWSPTWASNKRALYCDEQNNDGKLFMRIEWRNQKSKDKMRDRASSFLFLPKKNFLSKSIWDLMLNYWNSKTSTKSSLDSKEVPFHCLLLFDNSKWKSSEKKTGGRRLNWLFRWIKVSRNTRSTKVFKFKSHIIHSRCNCQKKIWW